MSANSTTSARPTDIVNITMKQAVLQQVFLEKTGLMVKYNKNFNIKYCNLGGTYRDEPQGICAEDQAAGGHPAGSQEH